MFDSIPEFTSQFLNQFFFVCKQTKGTQKKKTFAQGLERKMTDSIEISAEISPVPGAVDSSSNQVLANVCDERPAINKEEAKVTPAENETTKEEKPNDVAQALPAEDKTGAAQAGNDNTKTNENEKEEEEKKDSEEKDKDKENDTEAKKENEEPNKKKCAHMGRGIKAKDILKTFKKLECQ
ncbi:myb domain-containing protein, partial [Reticulomyxa filosa]